MERAKSCRSRSILIRNKSKFRVDYHTKWFSTLDRRMCAVCCTCWVYASAHVCMCESIEMTFCERLNKSDGKREEGTNRTEKTLTFRFTCTLKRNIQEQKLRWQTFEGKQRVIRWNAEKAKSCKRKRVARVMCVYVRCVANGKSRWIWIQWSMTGFWKCLLEQIS